MPTMPNVPQVTPQPPATPAAGQPSMFEGILKGALTGMGMASLQKNDFFGGLGRAELAQRQQAEQEKQDQLKQQQLDIQKQVAQNQAGKNTAQALLYRANAAKAMTDMLHTEAQMAAMPQEERNKTTQALGAITSAYLKAGYQGTEIEDTPQARQAFLQQMQQDGTNLEDVIFQFDPNQGKIIAFRPDPSRLVKADDANNVAKQLGLNVKFGHDVDPQVFNSLTSGAVRLMAENINQQGANARNAATNQTRLTAQQMADQTRLQASGLTGTGPNGTGPSLAQEIASGHVVPERLSYLLARNPALIQSVIQIDPSFDSSKAEAYPKTYSDFTSGKSAQAINAGGTAFMHLHELAVLASDKSSYIPGTKSYGQYQNLLDTISHELSKFYGNTTRSSVEGFKANLSSTLPWVRMGQIQQQAHAMGDKMDNFEQQWKNAAPSRAYEAPLPGLSNQAKQARAALDPDYQERLQQELGPINNTPAPANNGNPYRQQQQGPQ